MQGFILWLQHELLPRLGPGGVFVIAFLDSSFLSIPEVNDIFVVTSAAASPARAWIAVTATTLGSLAGCSVLWLLGKRGGEPFLRSKFGAARIERSRQVFARWNVLALALPAVLPPPMPFKVFVLSAGVFGIPFRRFLVTLAIARCLRYTFWGVMGVHYGSRALDDLGVLDRWFGAHIVPIGLGLVLLFATILWGSLRRARARDSAIIGG
jgi:membrane protein YqaA with SNARE-associated domain